MHTPLKLGFLYPGQSAVDDLPRLCHLLQPQAEAVVVHTPVHEDAHRVDALLALGQPECLLPGARQLAAAGVSAIIWACTSGSFVFGSAGAKEQAAAIEEAVGVPSSSTSLAFADALQALNIHQVAIAATYPRDVAEKFADFLGASGIQVVAITEQNIITAAEVGTLEKERVLAFVAASDHPDAEAIVVPDTALHTVAVLDQLEAMLGKPVLTANQVTVWQTLRLANALTPQSGLGRLFQGY
ncbi:maleate cis-trans isomerase [Natronospirillum operosum]|uniref:Maleate cis-trans isomerase n=1 Tax=Natronospirillum operosum TaxID=2759953 RepID=A0A4Z0W9Z4_9GAMM|nr:aspartate/glutamate racemase family protein [Natronospirillum operosum]TGG95439.1 maleate cis-trans isomerase [Natronospirillum operosum]